MDLGHCYCPRCGREFPKRWSKGWSHGREKCAHCRKYTAQSPKLCLHHDVIKLGGGVGWCQRCGEVLERVEEFYFSVRY